MREWSQKDLGEMAGLSNVTISAIERGRLRPYPVQLKKLAKALEVPEEWAHTLLEEYTGLWIHLGSSLGENSAE